MTIQLFSIIVPAKNEQDYIDRCLESIYSCGYDQDKFEVIVVDNGSKDNTVALVSKYPCKIFECPELKTISSVRNFGAKQSVGEILCFMDADCTVEHHWLQNAEKYVHHSEIVCYGATPGIPDDATWIERNWYLIRKKEDGVVSVTWRESTNMFVKRRAFDAVEGFDENLITCEDADISYRLRKYGLLVSDSDIRVIHHREPKTLLEFYNKELWRGISNFKGFLRHGIRIEEIPSLAFPLVYLALIIVSLCLIFFIDFVLGCAFAILWQIAFVVIIITKFPFARTFKNGVCLLLLFNVYLLSRGVAMIKSVVCK